MIHPEKEKFLAVLESHKKLIYKVSHTYCRDAEDLKDLVQEIIVQLWKAYPKYDSRYKFSTWIYRIALNTAISFYRRESRRQDTIRPLQSDLINVEADPYDTSQDENIAVLRQFIGQLDQMNKALMLLYLEDKSYQEIADILGITVTNVGSKLNRIRQQLKNQFKTYQQQ
jgi:RNA polymerase sigma-70 factor (ECF subfamily)